MNYCRSLFFIIKSPLRSRLELNPLLGIPTSNLKSFRETWSSGMGLTAGDGVAVGQSDALVQVRWMAYLLPACPHVNPTQGLNLLQRPTSGMAEAEPGPRRWYTRPA